MGKAQLSPSKLARNAVSVENGWGQWSFSHFTLGNSWRMKNVAQMNGKQKALVLQQLSHWKTSEMEAPSSVFLPMASWAPTL